MDLLHLVDRLEELLATAQKMPIGNRAILDRRRMLDIIDQMRIAVPTEVREAQEIVNRRDGIIREADEERRLIEAQAAERASRMVESHEITRAARERAEEIAREAELRLQARIDEANQDIAARIDESRAIASEQMRAADEYARELLQRLERQLHAFVKSVQGGIDQLQPAPITLGRVEVPRAELPDERPRAAAPVIADEPLVERWSEAEDRPRRERADLRDERHDERRDEGAQQGDLENLLSRSRPPLRGDEPRRGEARRSPAEDDEYFTPEPEPGVIDDFANEPLDDDPILRPRRPRDDR